MTTATQRAQQHLEDLLTFFEVNTTVGVKQEGETILLTVDSDLSGQLIGHRGETLSALQHLVNMMVRKELDERVYVHVDVGGYRKARFERLEAKAKKLAERVLEDGQEVVLPPMSPAERRHIHSFLADFNGVTTESQGEGSRRRLVIKITE